MKKERQFQIHIGGPQRAGKSSLASRLKLKLGEEGIVTVILDVDETNIAIFGTNAPIGSGENAARQEYSYHALFGLRIPDVLSAGATAIMTASHAQSDTYQRAAAVSDRFGVPLRYILLEPVATMGEVARRAREDTQTTSDMRNLETDRSAVQTYRATLARFNSIYRNPNAPFTAPHLLLPQGRPDEMLDLALAYVMA